MRKLNKLILLIFLTFLSCKGYKKSTQSNTTIYKDSTLTIFDFAANSKPNQLNSEKAKLLLNKHFKEKGY